MADNFDWGIPDDPGGGDIQYGGGGGGYDGGSGVQGLGNFGNDPFGYTGGSMLTPWTQKFVAPPGSTGGGGGISMNPFSYGNFSYDYRPPSAYQGQQDIAPDTFGYGEFQSPQDFKAPTAADMTQDPGYQFRLKQGQDAMLASASSKGLARSGDFAKAMANYNQDAASQEYDKVYGRKKGEYDTTGALARQDFNTRYSNAKDINQTNAQRRFDAAKTNQDTRLAGYQASTDANIRGNQLGYDIAGGAYDRNRQNAKDAYDSAMQIAQANASAGSSSANQAYNRALDEYKMNYEIFNNNQNTQWNRTMDMTKLGMGAAGAQGGYSGDYGQAQGNTFGQRGNAGAAGTMGSANAWAGGLSGLGDAAMQAAGAYVGSQNGGGGDTYGSGGRYGVYNTLDTRPTTGRRVG